MRVRVGHTSIRVQSSSSCSSDTVPKTGLACSARRKQRRLSTRAAALGGDSGAGVSAAALGVEWACREARGLMKLGESLREDLRAPSAAFVSWMSCPALTSRRRKRLGEVSETTESTDCEPSAPRPLRAYASRTAFASWKSCPALTSGLRRRPGEAIGLGARLASTTRSDFTSTRSDSHSVEAAESRHPQKDAVSPKSAVLLKSGSGRSEIMMEGS